MVPKFCLKVQFLYQEIRWNCHILRSDGMLRELGKHLFGSNIQNINLEFKFSNIISCFLYSLISCQISICLHPFFVCSLLYLIIGVGRFLILGKKTPAMTLNYQHNKNYAESYKIFLVIISICLFRQPPSHYV